MQDFQKRQAIFDKWSNNGRSTPKADRNKGRGRIKDKQLVQQELVADDYSAEEELAWAFSEETEENIYCHLYGPCDRCK